MRKLAGWITVSIVLVIAACGGTNDLETRTIELDHLESGEAYDIVEPYVFTDREGAPGTISLFDGGLTVRETGDNLAKIERVLERLDRPRPSVRLRFQLIRADGEGSDPAIAHVESLLRDLFRYEGYRLLEEVPMTGVEGTNLHQTLSARGRSYRIEARLERVRAGEEGGTVKLSVELQGEGGLGIGTTVTVPLGQTVVLGSSAGSGSADGGAIILTVHPELLEAGGGPSS